MKLELTEKEWCSFMAVLKVMLAGPELLTYMKSLEERFEETEIEQNNNK